MEFFKSSVLQTGSLFNAPADVLTASALTSAPPF